MKEGGDPGDANIFRTVVASVGFILGIITFIGVGAVANSKRLSFRGYEAYCNERGFLPPEPHVAKKVEWGVKTGNTLLTLLPDIFTPILFTVSWICLLVGLASAS
jgi:hypothetical protein